MPNGTTPENKRKRGRRPKGGKLIVACNAPAQLGSNAELAVTAAAGPTVIVHLRCRLDDLKAPPGDANAPLPARPSQSASSWCEPKGSPGGKDLAAKLASLTKSLHTDNVSDTRAACFWCTHHFDHPPVHIPRHATADGYSAYGCFCSPQCAAAFLFKENIDSAARFERYHLLNYVYGAVYGYKKNIKPAPDPHYTLDKFYGNLSIDEYRDLLQKDKLLLVVDKPLTRVLPDLLVDDETFVRESGAAVAGGKYRLRRKIRPSKSQVLSDKFNLPPS